VATETERQLSRYRYIYENYKETNEEKYLLAGINAESFSSILEKKKSRGDQPKRAPDPHFELKASKRNGMGIRESSKETQRKKKAEELIARDDRTP
jgi:hypothetical protein